MFSRRSDQSFPLTGTTTPIYVPRNESPKGVQLGKDYLFVQIYGAQAAFSGQPWEHTKAVIVTSQVTLNHASLANESLHAIQRSREVKKDRAEQLGLSPNLIKLVPAVMPHLSISLEFILDKENRLAQLAGMINSDNFLAAVSIAPVQAMIVKTISNLAQKLIATFIPAKEHQPILQFSGDFNLAGGELREGYYVILGTRDEYNPIPDPLPTLTVHDGELLANDERITQLSYVVLDVRRVDARTRDLNDNALWDAKLREAESTAEFLGDDPSASIEEREQAWEKCKSLLQEARVLLIADPNYLYQEATLILRAAFKYCSDQLRSRTKSGSGSLIEDWTPDTPNSRALIGIAPDEDISSMLYDYAEKVAYSRVVFEQAGIT